MLLERVGDMEPPEGSWLLNWRGGAGMRQSTSSLNLSVHARLLTILRHDGMETAIVDVDAINVLGEIDVVEAMRSIVVAVISDPQLALRGSVAQEGGSEANGDVVRALLACSSEGGWDVGNKDWSCDVGIDVDKLRRCSVRCCISGQCESKEGCESRPSCNSGHDGKGSGWG